MSDSPVVKQKKDGTKKADAQPAPRVLRPERVRSEKKKKKKKKKRKKNPTSGLSVTHNSIY
jgi:hypothetical protein